MLLLMLPALAQGVPDRVVPPSVLVELQDLENDFELALALDCDASRCFSKGCTYIDHETADRARSTSLPGLGDEAGPGSEPAQDYLTRARCSYAHEQALETADVQSLNRRLQAKLSGGWTTVSVTNQALQELPEYLRGPVEAEEIEIEEVEEEEAPPPPPPPETWTQQLWGELLPHIWWMVGIGLATLAGMMLIWGWRRLGKASLEEQALLAELTRGDPPTGPPAPVQVVSEADEYVAEQRERWSARLEDNQHALLKGLLRSDEREVLVKALMLYPELSAAFPTGGDVASDKLALAQLITSVDPDDLPDDAEFFERLNRHALSATLASQTDTSMLRRLHDDFGASGLAELIAKVPKRIGGLLFALSPVHTQLEMARLLAPEDLSGCARQLLISNRMDRDEASWLFGLLESAKTGAMPSSPAPSRVADQGPVFDAAGALSVLLSHMGPELRGALFGEALNRFRGTLPAWHAEILVPDMLFALSDEARADLMLSLDVDALRAWLSVVPEAGRQALIQAMPNALKATVMGPLTAQPARAVQGRIAMARGFQRQLRRAGLSFERVVSG